MLRGNLLASVEFAKSSLPLARGQIALALDVRSELTGAHGRVHGVLVLLFRQHTAHRPLLITYTHHKHIVQTPTLK